MNEEWTTGREEEGILVIYKSTSEKGDILHESYGNEGSEKGEV